MPAPITELPADAHPKIRAIHDHWRDWAPSPDLLPQRRQIDPLQIPKLLESLSLVDVVGDPPRFRLRLLGGAIKRMGMQAAPGDFVDQHMPADAQPLHDLAHVTAERQPVWYRGRAYMPHETVLFSLERIFLPLADDGHNVNVVMGLTVFFDADGREL